MNLLEVGSFIKEQRKNRQMSQLELAEKVGVSRSTVIRLENGSIDELGLRKLIAICTHLGLTIDITPIKPKRPTLETLVKEQKARRAARQL